MMTSMTVMIMMTDNIAPTSVCQVPLKDLEQASKILVQMLMVREKYMAMSQQSFPRVTARFLQSLEEQEEFVGVQEVNSKASIMGESPSLLPEGGGDGGGSAEAGRG